MKDGRWQEIERLYNCVVKLEPDQRTAYLDRNCSDESLKREVISLLAVPSAANAFIETPVLEVAARNLAGERSRNASLDLAGRTLSHYRIAEKLGEGGMGVVYKAIDTRLSRPVALKLLPPDRVSDPERKRRFVQEARAASALNHKNIVTIYDISHAEGIDFIAMEYMAGKTLDRCIQHRGMPIAKALRLATQMADGLAAAHAAGIIHRDFKPSNIMVSDRGEVKILDFGLAKLVERTESEREGSLTASLQDASLRTDEGVILGTPSYMSPEQAQGKKVDSRSDIFSFATVLYEMISGRRAFQSDGIASTLAAIIRDEPKGLREVAPSVPDEIEKIIRRCLRKDPALRLQHMDDIKIALDDLVDEPCSSKPPGTASSGLAARRFRPIYLMAAALLIFAAGILVEKSFRVTSSLPVTRSVIMFPDGVSLTRGSQGPTRTEIALAPDGSRLVFSASVDGSEKKSMLYIRSLDRAEASGIPGTEGARVPFFSPDGRWIGFWTKQKLNKVQVDGGIPAALCDLPEVPMGASWGSDGRIVFGTELEGLKRVSSGGGIPEPLTRIDATGEVSHRLPCVLPGVKAVVFTAMPYSLGAAARVELLRLQTGARKILIEDGADARYFPTGHLVFLRRGTLMAVPFDINRLEVTGPAAPVVDGVMQASNDPDRADNSASGQYACSEPGTLAYASGGIFPDPEFKWYWVDRKGKAEAIEAFGRKPVSAMVISPDGRRIAYVTAGMDANLWMYDIPRGTSTKLTMEGRALIPTWSPDGSRIAFAWTRAGIINVWSKAVIESGGMEQLTNSEFRQWPASWTRDGKFLALIEDNPTTGTDILVLGTGDRQVRRFLCTKDNEGSARFSPDGRWLAYVSNASGRNEVYARNYPAGDKVIQISNQGGVSPLWAPNARELFYWDPGRTKLMSVEIRPGEVLAPRMPRVLFEFAAASAYDITPDGKLFLIPGRPEVTSKDVTQLNLVQNWLEELKRLAPPKP